MVSHMRRALLLLQVTLYPHIAIFRTNSGLAIINNITNQICRNYLLLYIPWTVHERPCLLYSMVYQPHTFPPPITSLLKVFHNYLSHRYSSCLWDVRSDTTSVHTSEIGKYPDEILPQHGLWTMVKYNCHFRICDGNPSLALFGPRRVEVVSLVRPSWVKLYYVESTVKSNIRRTLVGNTIFNHSDEVGTSPVGAPTASSFST